MDFEIMHIVEKRKLKTANKILVFLSNEFNRKKSAQTRSTCDTNPNTNLNLLNDVHASDFECEIDKIWADRISKNAHLFNATKFRVHSISSSENEMVSLFLGITDYKEFIGTNWSPNAKDLQQRGIEAFSNSQAFLSDALGVGASVLTEDNKLILLKRSEFCAEAPSLWDVPGGHAEPMNIVGSKPLQDIDVTTMSSAEVLHEIFDSIQREVVDEVNIPLEKLGEPFYMGTHRNKLSAGRPSLAFAIRCFLTSEEVQQKYTEGNQSEADETTSIMFISLDDISRLVIEKNDLWNMLAPSAKGNLSIFCLSNASKFIHGYY